MTAAAPSAVLSPDEAWVWRWGRVALALALAAGVALTLALAAWSPLWALALPAAVAAAGGVWAVGRYPAGHFCGVMALFAASASYEEGVQPAEVAFLLYYVGYLAHWYATRLWIRPERLVVTKTDAAVVFFLCYMTASLGLTLLYGGSLTAARGDWIGFSMLAFYFPVKELCARHASGRRVLAGVLLALGVFVFAQNLLMLKSKLADAEYAWQIARGRIPMNEMVLLVGALLAATLMAQVRGAWRSLGLLTVFAACTVGILLTQWRAYYVDLGLGVGLLLVLFRGARRRRLAGLTAASLLAIVGIGYVALGDMLTLIALGLADRLLSIGTAAQTDISLLNRLFETSAVWDLIRANPVVGYGIGTEFGFFDATRRGTWVKSFVHNGYLMVWFKFGLVGLVPLLFVWLRSIASALGSSRDRRLSGEDRAFALFAAVTLLALLPSHAVSAAFSTPDTVLMFALVLGLASGLAARATALPLSPAPA